MTFGALCAALTASASFVCLLTKYGSTNLADVGVAAGNADEDDEAEEGKGSEGSEALNFSVERERRSLCVVFKGVIGLGDATSRDIL